MLSRAGGRLKGFWGRIGIPLGPYCIPRSLKSHGMRKICWREALDGQILLESAVKSSERTNFAIRSSGRYKFCFWRL